MPATLCQPKFRRFIERRKREKERSRKKGEKWKKKREKREKGRKRDAMIRRRDAYAQGRKINYSTPFDLRVQATTYRTEYRNRPRELLYSVCIHEKNGGGVGKSVNRDYCNYCILPFDGMLGANNAQYKSVCVCMCLKILILKSKFYFPLKLKKYEISSEICV